MGWIYDESTDIGNDYPLIITRIEPTGDGKGDIGDLSTHIGLSEGSHVLSRSPAIDIYGILRDNNHSDYYDRLFQVRHTFLNHSILIFLRLCVLVFFHSQTVKVEDSRMGGDKLRLEPNKVDEFKAKLVAWFVCVEGGIDKLMENMKGNDERLSKQFMTSWEDRRVTMGGISFEINEEVIAQVTGLSMEGSKWKKQSRIADSTNLNQFFRQGKNPIKRVGGFNREELPHVWDEVCYIVMKYFMLEGRLKCLKAQLEEVLAWEEPYWSFVNSIPPLVNEDDNKMLMAPFTNGELREVVFSMPPEKALRPDGFMTLFFQKCWDFVENDVLLALEESRRNRTILKELNTTLIAIIPKVDNPNSFSDFHPIALCNTLYKIITKAISVRLSKLIPRIVSIDQGRFVPGRETSKGAIVAHEISHSISLQKTVTMILKSDMLKAYGVPSLVVAPLQQPVAALQQQSSSHSARYSLLASSAKVPTNSVA
ncbi:uncharacterized protein LOC131857592 [Cryptomeria japonica]|uniref:uncharacterized protein LOC131857592 n=1 Tax=Cryptomeria japonica TaxID=3369 RepID=UPI0027DA0488|nr:uncharacterized protein LOC131857592 [Cryptomeria japonica]